MSAFAVVFDGHMEFSCVIPRSGEEFLRAQEVFHEATRDLNTRGMLPFGPFALIQSSHPRNFLYLAILPTSRTDAAINRNTRAVASRLIGVAAENGWGLYRALLPDRIQITVPEIRQIAFNAVHPFPQDADPLGENPAGNRRGVDDDDV